MWHDGDDRELDAPNVLSNNFAFKSQYIHDNLLGWPVAERRWKPAVPGKSVYKQGDEKPCHRLRKEIAEIASEVHQVDIQNLLLPRNELKVCGTRL